MTFQDDTSQGYAISDPFQEMLHTHLVIFQNVVRKHKNIKLGHHDDVYYLTLATSLVGCCMASNNWSIYHQEVRWMTRLLYLLSYIEAVCFQFNINDICVQGKWY
jgi:hypothetical protein